MFFKQTINKSISSDVLCKRELSEEECELVSGGSHYLSGKIIAAGGYTRTNTMAIGQLRGGSNDFAAVRLAGGTTLDEMVAQSAPLVCGN